MNGQVCQYRTNVHLLGVVSLFVAGQFCPQPTAESSQEQFGQEAAHFLKNSRVTFMYTLDKNSFGASIIGIGFKQSIGAYVNLRLLNFSSNSKILLKALPMENRAKYVKDLDLRHDVLPVQNLIS